MPESLLLLTPSFTRPRLSQAIIPTAMLVIVAGLIGMLAVRIGSPVYSLGFFAVSISIIAAVSVMLCLFWVRTWRSRIESEALSAVFGGPDVVAFSEREPGGPIRGNDQFTKLLNEEGASNVAGILRHFFDDASRIEKDLRSQFKDRSRGEAVLPDRNGKYREVVLFGNGQGPNYWTIRLQHDSFAAPDVGALDEIIAKVTLGADGKVNTANELSERLGLTDGSDILEKLVGPFKHGTICQFKGNTQKFKAFKFELEEESTRFIFMPVDGDELGDATPDQFIHALPVALARVSPSGEILHINASARKLIGDNAIAGTNLNEHLEGLGRSIDERIRDIMLGRFHMRTEVARGHVNGHEIFLQVTLDRVNLNGESSILVVMNDATELKTLEAQFVQSQKMQAVGQLAGGVAHDFNNLLTAINGHCDLILMRHDPADTDYGDLVQIRHNANRAASLVGQLLAFSRKQTLLPKVIDLYDTLSDLNHLLNRLLGEKVNLRMEHGDDLPNVRVDERQLEQVIMNLVVNARDAMPNGGEVLIQTKTAVFEHDYTMDQVVIPFGTYVQIDVTDTGVGIPPDKITKIFEPFFTTKSVGEGTGLGLSTAYGIIKQTGGFIFAKSEVGAGTTFTLYLPTHWGAAETASTEHAEKPEPTDLTGRGNVLLVEDEVPVRSFAARALNIRGYSVVEAGSAEEALEILEDDKQHFDVFVSDVIMPGMDGPTWVRMAQEKRPEVKVVFVSGYAEDAFGDGKISVPNATFLQKPFSLNELTHTVKEQLDAPIQ